MKIVSNVIQNITILISNITSLILVGINRIISLELFNQINKNFNFRNILVLPNIHSLYQDYL